MSWRAIVRNDLRSAARERGTWGLFAGFLLGFGGPALVLLQLGDPEFEAYLDLLAPGVGLLVPLAGIVLGYETVVGERESGTAVLSLSMPHSRADLVVGKLVGKTAILAGVGGGAALLTGVGMLFAFPSFSVGRYVGFTLVSTLYGVVFLWLAAALSMALSTSRRVIAAAFGTYIGLTLFWSVVVDVVEVVLFRFQPSGAAEPETWVTFTKFVGPNASFNYLLGHLLDAGSVPPVAADSSAAFVSAELALFALLTWATLPMLAGYYSFRRSDL